MAAWLDLLARLEDGLHRDDRYHVETSYRSAQLPGWLYLPWAETRRNAGPDRTPVMLLNCKGTPADDTVCFIRLADLERLVTLAEGLRPRQVLVLGDLIHGRQAPPPELRRRLRQLPDQLGCPLRLIGGNHELGSQIEGLPQEAALGLGPLWLSHAPDPRPGWLNLCGHVHPVALIRGTADRLRLPGFAFRPLDDCLVLPGFGHLTGGHPCQPGESVWVVADNAIVAWKAATPATPGRRRPS